jgi:hypothetical protein
MLRQMESLARKQVIIFTPNGFLPQKSRDGDLQEHQSGWTAQEFRQKGYSVVGWLGPKSLRGEYHRIIRRPRWFWLLISLFAHQFVTRVRPEKSAALLCVKSVG